MPDLVFTTNRLSSPVRNENWNGKDWLVAPVVGLVPGVLNGELVTREAVKPSEKAWDGVPLVIEHPKRGGQFISAQEAGVSHVGVLRKPHVNGKLQGEMWFDVAALNAQGTTGEKVLQALNTGTVLEVSTGYFRSIENKPGILNGTPYQSVAHDITPDHLAVLLAGPGACSVKDGCGVPRVNGALTGNQGHTGVILALIVSDDDAQALALQSNDLPAGSIPVPPEELHVTLGYYGDLTDLEADGKDPGQMLDAVMGFAKTNTLVRSKLNGLARFLQIQEDGSQALVMLLDSPMLESWRRWLVGMVEDMCDLHPMRNHAFTPHITLAYIPANAPTPDLTIAQRDMVFNKLALAWGGQVTAFELQGESMDTQPSTNQAEEAKQKLTVKSALRAIAGAFGITLKEADMDKTKVIQQLVANGCPLDESALNALPDDKLEILAGKFTAPEPKTDPAPEPVANVEQTPAPAGSPSPELAALTGMVEKLTAQVSTLIANQKTAEDAEKAKLVESLVANQAPLPKAALEKLDLGELQTLAQNLIPADYSLQTLSRQAGNGEWQTWDAFVAEKEAKK